MRAVALAGDGRLQVVSRAEPVPGPGEVVVAVACCGICGSDLHLVESRLLPAGAVLGHEFSGAVAAVGPGTVGVTVGDPVAVLPSTRCGTCGPCRAGRSNLCAAQQATVLGLGLNDGGFAEHVRVRASSCHRLPASASFEQGALVEPYAVAVHAVGRSRALAEPGLPAAVLGAGSIGLMCVAALRRAGVERVAAVEPNARRRAVASAMGAVGVERSGDLGRALGRAPEVVFDTTGRPSSTPDAVEMVAPGGQVVLLGVVGPAERLGMPGLLWVLKEIDVLASIAYTDDEFAAAVAAVVAGAVDTAALAPEVRPLEEAEAAFEDLRGPQAPAQVLLSPRG